MHRKALVLVFFVVVAGSCECDHMGEDAGLDGGSDAPDSRDVGVRRMAQFAGAPP